MSFVDPQGGAGAVARKVWYWSVIRGVLAVIFGIVALVAPLETALVFAIVIGIFAVVDGVFAIIDAIRHRGGGGMGWRIALGVIDILFGFALWFWPGLSLVVLVYLAGFWAIILGILEIIASIQSRKLYDGWAWGLISGVLAVIFGIVIVVQPGVGLVTLTWIIGIFAIVVGIAWIIFGIRIRKSGEVGTTGAPV
jgi:uncharacterized membrane protein HdeD (DUF308 family)